MLRTKPKLAPDAVIMMSLGAGVNIVATANAAIGTKISVTSESLAAGTWDDESAALVDAGIVLGACHLRIAQRRSARCAFEALRGGACRRLEDGARVKIIERVYYSKTVTLIHVSVRNKYKHIGWLYAYITKILHAILFPLTCI